MPTTDRLFLDTNVLLAATDEDRSTHREALVTINERPAAGTVLYLSGQVLREYLVVATRPVSANGLGLSISDAVTNVDAFGSRATLLEETEAVSRTLRQLVGAKAIAGKRIHDANVVATMSTHGIHTLITENVQDFVLFDDIDVLPLV